MRQLLNMAAGILFGIGIDRIATVPDSALWIGASLIVLLLIYDAVLAHRTEVTS